MNSWRTESRRLQTAQRKIEREAKQHQRELDRRLKEQAKLSAQERARLEVESYENDLSVLLSVHKERSTTIDWKTLATELPPYEPVLLARHELRALGKKLLREIFLVIGDEQPCLEEASSIDEKEHWQSCQTHKEEFSRWEQSRSLAIRILAGEGQAYGEAVAQCSALVEVAQIGSTLNLTIHNAKLLTCQILVRGRNVIPAQTKSLAASGKVSIKPMPKGRFHEIYQDYVCGCVLRLAREILALLPVNVVIVTATVEGIDTRTGQRASLPVLSLAAPRNLLEKLNFERLDPAESLSNFLHRGDVTTSRKSGEFVPIIPLTPADLEQSGSDRVEIDALFKEVRQLTADISALLRRTNKTNPAN